MPAKTVESRALGQYFTPSCVVDFACQVLLWLDECRARTCAPPDTPGGAQVPALQPRAIDPACGDGAFVLGALRNALARPEGLVGIDRDPALAVAWLHAGLGGPEGPRMRVADGLLPSAAMDEVAPPESFDFVLGNPPYHGHGVRHEADADLAVLSRTYSLWRPGEPTGAETAARDVSRLRLYPIELLFLERFLQLARAGGLIAIVLPEGVFANARRRPERQWLFARHTVHGIVGLPRSAFHAAGITAKTCLLSSRRCRLRRGTRCSSPRSRTTMALSKRAYWRP